MFIVIFIFSHFFLTFYLFPRPHKCPEPKYRYYAPSNLTTRLKRREVRMLEVETDKWLVNETGCLLYLFFFLPIEYLSCSKLQFTRLLSVNVHPEKSRISFFLSFFSFFFSVGHTSSRGFQWRKVQSAICLRQVRERLGLFYLNSVKSSCGCVSRLVNINFISKISIHYQE